MAVARFLVPGAAGLLALCAGAGAAAAGDAYGRSHVPVVTRYVPVSRTVTTVLTLHPADLPGKIVTRTVPGPAVTVTVPGPRAAVTRTVTAPGPAVTRTVAVPGPAVTVTRMVPVPGPTLTVPRPVVTAPGTSPALTAVPGG